MLKIKAFNNDPLCFDPRLSWCYFSTILITTLINSIYKSHSHKEEHPLSKQITNSI